MFDWLGFHVFAVVAVALILGGMVFFAAFMTPMVFAKLPRATAGAFLAQVFPVYYQARAGGAGPARQPSVGARLDRRRGDDHRRHLLRGLYVLCRRVPDRLGG